MKALQDLESAASGDASVRQKIASLPQEVQDVSLLEKITGEGPVRANSGQSGPVEVLGSFTPAAGPVIFTCFFLVGGANPFYTH